MSGLRVRTRLGVVLVSSASLLSACAGHGMYVREGIDTCVGCAAAEDQLDARVVLIGDTGESEPGNGNLELLVQVAGAAPERTTIVFLGDNVYPRGIPASLEIDVEAERRAAEQVLLLWLRTVERSGAAAVFVPGNHDWRKGAAGGMARVLEQARFVRQHAADPLRVRVLPEGACPGPMILDLGAHARVLVADTEWLLTTERLRGEYCAWGSPEAPRKFEADNAAFYRALAEASRTAGGRHVLLASHHPLRTRGPHGGQFSAKQFFFPFTEWKSWLYLPLPVLYPVVRYGIVRHPQDLVSGRYQEMIAGIDGALEAAPGKVLAVAGHEHVLQVFEEGDTTYAVSGAGAHTDVAGVADSTLFKHGEPGLMAVDYFRDGRVLLRVIEPREGATAAETFGRWLVER